MDDQRKAKAGAVQLRTNNRTGAVHSMGINIMLSCEHDALHRSNIRFPSPVRSPASPSLRSPLFLTGPILIRGTERDLSSQAQNDSVDVAYVVRMRIC